MLKSSPLVQKHGMAGGPYTCWDKFCKFLLSDLVCNWVENFASHFHVFHTKDDSWKGCAPLQEKWKGGVRGPPTHDHPLPSYSDRSWHLLPIRNIRPGQFQYYSEKAETLRYETTTNSMNGAWECLLKVLIVDWVLECLLIMSSLVSAHWAVCAFPLKVDSLLMPPGTSPLMAQWSGTAWKRHFARSTTSCNMSESQKLANKRNRVNRT